jgi:hypothetical protein
MGTAALLALVACPEARAEVPAPFGKLTVEKG